MQIFSELVKSYWNGTLNNAEDLKKLAEEIKAKYAFDDKDLPFIYDHIRIAMGLDPVQNSEFHDELDIIKSSHVVGKPVVAKIQGACEYCEDENCKCQDACKYEANIYKRTTGPIIVNDKCLNCGECVSNCDFGALADKIEFIPMIDFLKDSKTPVYAAVAPAIVGQFGDDVSMGQLRTAFKLLGFTDMIEVAMFADILTIREALEFSEFVKDKDDFFLTSCCCPVWFNLIKKNYPNILDHMSPAISPMIAAGRILKKLYEDVKVVFISPCIAKKAEIKEAELEGAVDFVLSFRELDVIFKTLGINPSELQGDDKDQASMGGRLYARTGGVSFSVKTVVNRLEPTRVVKLKAIKVDGVKDCRKILDDLSLNKEIDANFIEGMGCLGGCVGGPKTNIDKDSGTKKVNDYGEDSLIMTPFDNLNVMKILRQLGIQSIEEIIEKDKMKGLLGRNK